MRGWTQIVKILNDKPSLNLDIIGRVDQIRRGWPAQGDGR
jgi:hypothetical protein